MIGKLSLVIPDFKKLPWAPTYDTSIQVCLRGPMPRTYIVEVYSLGQRIDVVCIDVPFRDLYLVVSEN